MTAALRDARRRDIARHIAAREAAAEAAWAAADSLPDLTDLTVRWLTGDIATQPGYLGLVDVDEDQAPGLTAALIAVNRAGILTSSSQAGVTEPGWVQHAWLSAYAPRDRADALIEAARAAGYGARRVTWFRRPVAVTFQDGRPFTVDRRTSRVYLLGSLYPWVGEGAWDDLCRVVQVGVWDPIPGRNTLWGWLRGYAGRDTPDSPVRRI